MKRDKRWLVKRDGQGTIYADMQDYRLYFPTINYIPQVKILNDFCARCFERTDILFIISGETICRDCCLAENNKQIRLLEDALNKQYRESLTAGR